jgi:predicted HicB family RNase H-like nuclease
VSTTATDELTATIVEVARASAKMSPVPSLPPGREPKKQRNLRVEDQLWEKAEKKAAAQGRSTAEYVRALIDRDTQDD